MLFLSVAVAVLAALVLVDLVLTGAVIRRLRDTERQLHDLTVPPTTGLLPGEPMPEFAADGLTRADLAGRQALVAFFSDTCRHCPPQAERLAERADEFAARDIAVVSVLTVTEDDSAGIAPLLTKAGRVLGDPDLAATFRADSTPSFLLFDESGGLVRESHLVDEVLSAR